ncbi:helix-turn-helix transcriptional regulator [Lacimonas salitolerans]|uniref:Helix-turn-helix transcriptional regulator n=1 Tax=Lacimonas salitolerans TaxID=1323750 RepID=A0ABW4EKM1_9RHOB
MAEQQETDILAGYLTREQLAEKLGVTKDTVARWSTQGIGPDLIKVGRKVFYSEEAIREWLKTRVVRKG